MSGDTGNQFREQSGSLSSFVLDSLRGLGGNIQYQTGKSVWKSWIAARIA